MLGTGGQSTKDIKNTWNLRITYVKHPKINAKTVCSRYDGGLIP